MRSTVDAPALARSYRRFIVTFAVQLILGLVPQAAEPLGESPAGLAVRALALVGLLVSVGFLSYYAFRTAEAFGSRLPWLWAASMVVPCANLAFLLALTLTANRACRKNGIAVGLLGPRG